MNLPIGAWAVAMVAGERRRHVMGTARAGSLHRGRPGAPYRRLCGLLLRAIGFRHVVEREDLESIEVPGGARTGLLLFGVHGDRDDARGRARSEGVA